MRRDEMDRTKVVSQGFTLIASLLLLILLSGFAIGLLMMVNTEQRAGGNDLNNNYSYHAAEGAIEKMTSDLGATFKAIQSPTASQICALSNNYPTWDATVSYVNYNVAPQSGCTNALATQYGQIQSGSDAGLSALIIPVTMNATVKRLSGETVSMTRTAQVALIPVFQFGIFSDSDLFFGRTPNLGFAGRIHTNGDLYIGVADAYTLVFGDKIAAFGNVIRTVMDNNVTASGNDDNGPVLIPTTSGGCATQLNALANGSTPLANTTCAAIGANDGSVTAGHASTQNTGWQNVSLGTYNGYIIDGNVQPNGQAGPNNTGASNLSLPFVSGTSHPFEIIRRPPVGESTSSLLGASRLENQAQIRVLLSDKQNDLHMPDYNGDPSGDIELTTLAPEVTGSTQTTITIGGHNYYFGESACGAATIGNSCTSGDTKFVEPPSVESGPTATAAASQAEWPLINGWLRVEAKWASDGVWHPVTREWLGLGFARGLAVPTAPRTNSLAVVAPAGTDMDMKDAILYLQVQADRGGNGSLDTTDNVTFTPVGSGSAITTPTTPYGTNSQYNWYPINFYDAREGENYDSRTTTFPYATNTAGAPTVSPTCTANGLMNSVELDVGNLKNWLAGVTGTTGRNVDYTAQNGYVLYFSDRRGMQYDTLHSPTALLGAYGFEDTINYAAGAPFSPNGTLEPVNYNGVSPEDVEEWGDGTISTYGVRTVGDAFGTTYANDTDSTTPKNPYAHRFQCYTVGRANRVTGARHVLTLVDGSLGNLPVMPAASACTQSATNPTGCGGFTVGSENPVYIQGNYNSNCPAAIGGTPNPCTPGNSNYDPTWTNTAAAEPIHAAAGIIADAVTLLSNNWQAAGVSGALTNGSLVNPVNNPNGQNYPAYQYNRLAVTSYFRVAIAAGKTIAFSNTPQNPTFAFGTDAGVGNFLRFLEDWGGPTSSSSQQSLYYKGSIVSLYWNTYATGSFKCCGLVYNPPNRQYTFDPLFTKPQNLPPGTPMFRNVNNLTYRQNQIALTTP
jgi:Tfp pilus assembly protein PilX